MIRKSAAPMAMAAMVASALSAQAEGPVSITFADAPLGALPPSFAAGRTGGGAPGDWKIVDDNTVAGGRVLAQTKDIESQMDLSTLTHSVT